MFPRSRSFSFFLLLVLAVSTTPLSAQNVMLTGTVSGRVTDQSGAVLPRAVVAVRNLDTSVEKSTETNDSGFYRLGALPPGPYSVSRRGTRLHKHGDPIWNQRVAW